MFLPVFFKELLDNNKWLFFLKTRARGCVRALSWVFAWVVVTGSQRFLIRFHAYIGSRERQRPSARQHACKLAVNTASGQGGWMEFMFCTHHTGSNRTVLESCNLLARADSRHVSQEASSRRSSDDPPPPPRRHSTLILTWKYERGGSRSWTTLRSLCSHTLPNQGS